MSGENAVHTGKHGDSARRYGEFQPDRKLYLEEYLDMKLEPPYVSMTSNRVSHAKHHLTAGDELSVKNTNEVLRQGSVFLDSRHPDTLVFVKILENAYGNIYGGYVVLSIIKRPGKHNSGYFRMRNNYSISRENAILIIKEGKRKKNGKKEYQMIL